MRYQEIHQGLPKSKYFAVVIICKSLKLKFTLNPTFSFVWRMMIAWSAVGDFFCPIYLECDRLKAVKDIFSLNFSKLPIKMMQCFCLSVPFDKLDRIYTPHLSTRSFYFPTWTERVSVVCILTWVYSKFLTWLISFFISLNCSIRSMIRRINSFSS